VSPDANVLRLLEQPGCAACNAREFSDDRIVFAFVTEHYTDPLTLDELRASCGLCPAHTRRVLERTEAPYVLRAVGAEAVAGALERMRTGEGGGAVARCPLCRNRATSEESVLRLVVISLSAPAVTEAYRANGGLCLPHALAALGQARPDAAVTIGLALADVLRTTDGEASLIERLAGCDPDRAARARLRDRLPDLLPDRDAEAPPPRATLAALHARLTVAACPSCFVGGLMERRYLAWLATEHRANARGLSAEGVWLCPTHLHDVLADDPPSALWAASLMRFRLQDELGRLTVALAAAPRRLRALLEPRRFTLRQALTPVLRPRDCSACYAVAAAEQRETALLLAALGDAPTARRYEVSHGLCLRHLLALPLASRAGAPARVLEARLRVLGWELEEAGRKSGWSVRHEARGRETTAWRRAAAQLDGRVFLGGSP
jgi:hypothetical protein